MMSVVTDVVIHLVVMVTDDDSIMMICRCLSSTALKIRPRPPLPRFPGDGPLRGSLFKITGLGIQGVPEARFAG